MRRASLLVTVVGWCFVSSAHRLDEYLQATRIGLSLKRIDVTLDLTPGVAIAQELLGSIDPGRHETIPRREATTYSQRVLGDLYLEVDGQRQALKLVRTTLPTRTEMENGEGTIRLHATARLRKLRTGPHQLLFRNRHLPNLSVYLVNTLAPESQTLIHITRQTRDELQQEYRLSFEVSTPRPTAEPGSG